MHVHKGNNLTKTFSKQTRNNNKKLFSHLWLINLDSYIYLLFPTNKEQEKMTLGQENHCNYCCWSAELFVRPSHEFIPCLITGDKEP